MQFLYFQNKYINTFIQLINICLQRYIIPQFIICRMSNIWNFQVSIFLEFPCFQNFCISGISILSEFLDFCTSGNMEILKGLHSELMYVCRQIYVSACMPIYCILYLCRYVHKYVCMQSMILYICFYVHMNRHA